LKNQEYSSITTKITNDYEQLREVR